MKSMDWVHVPDEINTEVEAFVWHAEDTVSPADEHNRANLIIRHPSGARCRYEGVPRSAAETLQDAVIMDDEIIFNHKMSAVRDLARRRTWNVSDPPETKLI